MNDEALQQVLAYHEATKHHYRAFAPGPGHLDWATQPDPFRRYAGAPLIQLARRAPEDGPPYEAGFHPGLVGPAALDHAGISQLFFDALALSAWKEYGGSRWALRVNPSSGNLHPTEGYLICGPTPGLCETPMVAHYAPREHALEVRATFPLEAWQALSAGLPSASLLVGLTSIHWREAWKYGERAYRYCQHDVGHALAALSVAAAGLGWRVTLLDSVGTEQLAALLGVSGGAQAESTASPGAEPEHPDCLVAVYLQGQECGDPDLPLPIIEGFRHLAWMGAPNVLSPGHVEWPWLEGVAEAAARPPTAPGPHIARPSAADDSAPLADDACLENKIASILSGTERPSSSGCGVQSKDAGFPDGRSAPFDYGLPPSAQSAPLHHPHATRWPKSYDNSAAPLSLRRIIHRRRSAQRMDGRTWLDRDVFYRMLDRTMPTAEHLVFDALPWRPHAHPALFVHRVTGLEPGLYFLARDPDRADELRAALQADFAWETPPSCPSHLPLYWLARGDVRGIARRISCAQEIASDGCFSLGMLTEFEGPLREHGAWFYPRLFWECGMVGQVLYLEAEAAGVRGTGIGCFFDDGMHELLGLRDGRWQSLYHFTVGGPVEDPRLTTLPAYP